MGHLIFQDILIIFAVSVPVVILFQQLKLPSLLGFLMTGALIGPEGIGWIQDQAQIETLAELGVALLLFSVGLEFSLASFVQLRRRSFTAGLLQIALTITAGTLIGQYLFGWTAYRGLYFGCLLSLSSTAVVLTTLYDRRMIDSIPGRLSTAILILQDLALIPMIVLLPLLRGEGDIVAIWHGIVVEAGQPILILAGVFVVGRFLASRILRQITRGRSRELFVITVSAIGLGMAWLTFQLGLSFALGAFLGGVMVGATDFKYQALSDISPFRYCFNSIFFVSIGMLLNFGFLREHAVLVLIFLLLIPTLKLLVTTTAARLAGFSLRIALVVGLSLGQIGEFSFLLAYIGQRTGVIQPFFYQLIVAVAVVAMLATPLMVTQAPRLGDWLTRRCRFQWLAGRSEEEEIQQAATLMKDHVVICGFGPLGETFGRILKAHRISYMVLELNPETIERIRGTVDNVFFGDGASEEILYRSGIERAKLLAITVPDFLNSAAIIYHARKLNPDIRIITRAKYRTDVDKLYQAGADVVISEELEGGIEMGRYTLREAGLSETEIAQTIEKVREFGSADFF